MLSTFFQENLLTQTKQSYDFLDNEGGNAAQFLAQNFPMENWMQFLAHLSIPSRAQSCPFLPRRTFLTKKGTMLSKYFEENLLTKKGYNFLCRHGGNAAQFWPRTFPGKTNRMQRNAVHSFQPQFCYQAGGNVVQKLFWVNLLTKHKVQVCLPRRGKCCPNSYRTIFS